MGVNFESIRLRVDLRCQSYHFNPKTYSPQTLRIRNRLLKVSKTYQEQGIVNGGARNETDLTEQKESKAT